MLMPMVSFLMQMKLRINHNQLGFSILLNQCQDFGVGAFVHFDAEVDEDDVADATNVWIHHSRHG